MSDESILFRLKSTYIFQQRFQFLMAMVSLRRGSQPKSTVTLLNPGGSKILHADFVYDSGAIIIEQAKGPYTHCLTG